MVSITRRNFLGNLAGGASAAIAAFGLPRAASAGSVTGFMQAVAEAAAGDRDIAVFYRETGFAPLWTGGSDLDRARISALVRALERSGDHGLPVGRYDIPALADRLSAVRSQRDLGRAEVELTRTFLQYARDVQTGFLTPRRMDDGIKRDVVLRDRAGTLRGFADASPVAFLRDLPPGTPDYHGLMRLKMDLEGVVASGGWGPQVPGGRLEQGDSGARVVALRDRMIRMGYLPRTNRAVFDAEMNGALRAFQRDHGLTDDGVAGPGTLGEINRSAEYRLQTVNVAMERERWLNLPGGRGERHVWVNLMDFRTKVYEHGKVIFETRSVVGENRHDKRTPEFSDQMEYMEINPDWTVPRSILGRDYLPKLQADPSAAPYLQFVNSGGQVIPRERIPFEQFTAENFPLKVRQPPGRLNALGTVKFMFPNPHAIYLHDTPQRHLFNREVRDYSSGCIRLHDPHDFAYLLLRRQMSNPEPYFQRILQSGRQTTVDLDQKVPVHLDYRTAFTLPKERPQFRRDIYGRDGRIWAAMEAAGVALRTRRS